MKKIFLLYPVVVLAALLALLYTSCKKPTHSLAPTPNNVRLMSYTATTYQNTVFPGAQADTVNDNYTFVYDANNRVTNITYTTNSALVYTVTGNYGEDIAFDYSLGNGYVIKTISNLRNATPPIEVDTFILNSQNLITQINTPGLISTYEYTYSPGSSGNGMLMSSKTLTYYNGGASVASKQIYNSYVGNFLDDTYNGTLTATFTNALTTPLDVSWTTSVGTVTHNPSNDGLSDILSTYNGLPMIVTATGNNSATAAGAYPGNIYTEDSFTVYSNLANRTGDYLQLASFTSWGYNLYQNANLVKSIINTGYTTTVTYNIDAYNRISQMTAVIEDSLSNTKTITYNLQYEIY